MGYSAEHTFDQILNLYKDSVGIDIQKNKSKTNNIAVM